MTDDLAISAYADEFEEAAEEAPDLERQDALRILAAVARGERAPKPVVKRVRQRYGDGSGRSGHHHSRSTPGRSHSSTGDGSSYCPSCGEGLQGGENYCPQCGDGL